MAMPVLPFTSHVTSVNGLDGRPGTLPAAGYSVSASVLFAGSGYMISGLFYGVRMTNRRLSSTAMVNWSNPEGEVWLPFTIG